MLLIDDSIELADREHRVRVRIGLSPESGSPFIALHDADGFDRVMIELNEKGHGALSFRAANGQPILSLGVADESSMGLMLLDVPNDLCLTVSIDESQCSVQVCTNEGENIWP